MKRALTSKDWFGKVSAGVLLGFALALGVSGLLPTLGIGSLSFLKTSGQFMMWLISPVWATVISLCFMFSSGLRAWLWLGAANIAVWGALALMGALKL